MKSIYIGALLALLLPLISIAQTASKSDANVTGHVESSTTKKHISYVVIGVKGTTIGIATDATGHFFLKNLPEGEFTLVASAMGYKTTEMVVTLVANRTIEVNFLMEEAPLNLSDVVVSATRNESNRRESSTIVNVASAKLFEAVASNNLSETMSFQPGLRVENNCGNCGITQLRINGLEGQYSQILLDSRAIFSSLSMVYGLEQLPVSMVERVEVVRGGGSALFGSSAIGGVINIITKEPLRNSLTLSNNTNILKGGTFDINTSLNGSFVTDDHKVGVYLFGMIKNRDWYDRNKDGFSDIPKIDSETVGFRGYYKTSLYSKITAEYHHIHEFRRGGNNFNAPAHEADVTEQLNHKIDGGGLSFDICSPDYKHRFSLFSSAQNINRGSYFGVDQRLDAYGKTEDITFIVGAQYTLNIDKFLFMPSELTAGFEYNYNDLDDVFMGLNRRTEQTTHISGGFVQNEWKSDKFSLLVGTRLDKHNMMRRAVFSPRANVRYSPSDKVGLRASYSSGYRAPQTYNEDLHVEAVNGDLSVIDLDPNLKPEYSHSFSASVDLYKSFGKLQANFLMEGFYTILDDIFTLEKTGEDPQEKLIYYTRRNGSGATVKGINLELKLGLPSVFEIQMGYTLQKSRFERPEQWSDQLTPQRRVFRAPSNYGYFTSSFDIVSTFKASVFGTYTGPMLVKHSYADVDSERITPNFFELGMKLAYTFRLSSSMNIEISGGVKNIFDNYQRDLDVGKLKDGAYVYGPSFPRLFFFGLKFSI